MSGLKKLIESPLIQVALATGTCIILLAYFSKRILPQPIGYLPLAIPPFLMTIHAAAANRYNYSGLWKTWYWVAAIFVTTGLIIVLHAF